MRIISAFLKILAVSLLVSPAFAGTGPDPDKSGSGRDGSGRSAHSRSERNLGQPPRDPICHGCYPGFLTNEEAGYVPPVPGITEPDDDDNVDAGFDDTDDRVY